MHGDRQFCFIFATKLVAMATSVKISEKEGRIGPIFTKILHDVVTLVVLFNLAHTWRYPIPFLNDRGISAGG